MAPEVKKGAKKPKMISKGQKIGTKGLKNDVE